MEWTWTIAPFFTPMTAVAVMFAPIIDCGTKDCSGLDEDSGLGGSSGPEDDAVPQDLFEGRWRRAQPVEEFDEDSNVTHSWEVELRPERASSLMIEMSSDAGTIGAEVFYEAGAGELTTKKTGWCLQEEGMGSYRYDLVADELVIELVDDPCETQSELLAATWERL